MLKKKCTWQSNLQTPSGGGGKKKKKSKKKKRLHSKDFAELGNTLAKIPTIMFKASKCLKFYSSPWRNLIRVPCLTHGLMVYIIREFACPLRSTSSKRADALFFLQFFWEQFYVVLTVKRCLEVPQELERPLGIRTQNWRMSLCNTHRLEEKKKEEKWI